jgi:hypothetical protein
MTAHGRPQSQLTSAELKMANWLLAYNERLREYGEKTYGEDGAVLYAAAWADFSLSCLFILVGTGGMAVSKFRGPVAGISLVLYVTFLILYYLGLRRFSAAKRNRIGRGN